MSPLCAIRELLDVPRAFVQRRPVIRGHRYIEQKAEPGQACCIQILKCEACGDVSIAWENCRCKPGKPTSELSK